MVRMATALEEEEEGLAGKAKLRKAATHHSTQGHMQPTCSMPPLMRAVATAIVLTRVPIHSSSGLHRWLPGRWAVLHAAAAVKRSG